LHELKEILELDPNKELRVFGEPHQARYDAALCWRLAQEALHAMRAWPAPRLEGVLQLLASSSYLRRFLMTRLGDPPLRPIRVPLSAILGPIPQPDSSPSRSPSPVPPSQAAQLLGPKGPFVRKLGLQVREIQCEMAHQIGRRLEQGGVLIAEAGTGTGKSLAALVSALVYARANPGEPVVISTYTHVLQHQIVSKDLPLLEKALETRVRAIVLKGQGNYLNVDAFDTLRSEHLRLLREGNDGQETRSRGVFLAYLLSWLCAGLEEERQNPGDWRHLFFGELEELSDWWRHAYGSSFTTLLQSLQETPPLLDEDASGRDGKSLQFAQRVAGFAGEAELIIANHALWMSLGILQDLSSRVIFDEAHHLEDAATSALTGEFTADVCRTWAQQSRALAMAMGRNKALLSAAEKVEKSIPGFARLFRQCLDHLRPPEWAQREETNDQAEETLYVRKAWLNRPNTDIVAQAREGGAWLDAPAGVALEEALSTLLDKAIEVSLRIPAGQTLLQQWVSELKKQIGEGLDFLRAVQSAEFSSHDDFCYWLEEDDRDLGAPPSQVQHFALKRAPIQVDDFLRERLMAEGRASVLMSATLSLRGGETVGPCPIDAPGAEGFTFLAERLGLTDPDRVTVWSRPSPFDYPHQMRVLFRQPTRSPSDPEEGQYLHELHAELLTVLRNAPSRGLVLFTSHRHLSALTDALGQSLHQDDLKANPFIHLLRQYPGSPVARLLERYRALLEQGKAAILLGTSSFWEGVDLSGEHSLRTVIVVRLPFPAAGEPIIEARSLWVERQHPGEQGGAFRHYLLPLALLRWRQGVGRLIRDHTSRGVVICLDRRAASSNYAHAFRQALPSGPTGAPACILCNTPEELVRAWAEFAAKGEHAEVLDIVERPWLPQEAPLPILDDRLSIHEQEKVLEEAAQKLVGEGYRRNEAQLKAMAAFAQGRDVLLTMPTGGGKSLCYQVPALTAPEGLTIVFSPLRALIQNQIDDLKEAGVPVPDQAGYLLGRDAQHRRQRARVRQLAEDGHLRLLYLTPEMASFDFALFHRLRVRRIVLDEAHCLLTWGTTFRPAYLRLAQRIRDWRERAGADVAIMACSATLTEKHRQALCQYLGLRDPIEIHGRIDRPNIYWGVDIMPESWEDRDRRLQEVLSTLPHHNQAIVYTTFTRTCEQVADGLIRSGFRAAAYHGKMDNPQREAILGRFENGPEDLQIIVATKAFGMGINNRRVAMVIHYNHPESLTEYYQQAGRAGRDPTQRALALTLYDARDRRQHELLQEKSSLQEDLLRRVLSLVSEQGSLWPEEVLIERIGGERWEAQRKLRRALELLANAGMIYFHEVIAQAVLARGWSCPSEPPDELPDDQRELIEAWLPSLQDPGELYYRAASGADLETCLSAEALISTGVQHNWWRLRGSSRYVWLAPGPEFHKDITEVLAKERVRAIAELDQMVAFLEDDTGCRRSRLVSALSPDETPPPADPCCDVCQVARGLGHPWLDQGSRLRFRSALQPVEAVLFSLLEDNDQPEKDFLNYALMRIQGSHLAHKDRLQSYLQGLQRHGLVWCHRGIWRLTALGQKCLESRDWPAWEEVVSHGGHR